MFSYICPRRCIDVFGRYQTHAILVGLMAALMPMSMTIAQQVPSNHAVRFENQSGMPLSIWFWPRGTSKWPDDPLLLRREGGARVILSAPGSYFLVVRDLSNTEERLGWWNLHNLVDVKPNAVIVVSGGHVTELKDVQQTYTVQIPYTEMRRGTRTVYNNVTENVEQTYTVTVPYTLEGRTYYRSEQRTRTVQVTKQVASQQEYEYPVQLCRTEQRTRTVQVSVTRFSVQLQLSEDGKLIPLRDVIPEESAVPSNN